MREQGEQKLIVVLDVGSNLIFGVPYKTGVRIQNNASGTLFAFRIQNTLRHLRDRVLITKNIYFTFA